MRRTYSCLIALADGAGHDRVTARALAKQWVGHAYGGWPEHTPELWHPVTGVKVQWRLLRDPEGSDEAFELVWTRPHRLDSTLLDRTTVQITTRAGLGRIVVMEQLESADPKVREAPVERIRRPDLVPDLVASIACVDGGWPMSATAVHLTAERAVEFDAFVRGDRLLPVVLIAADAAGRVQADVRGIVDELAGIAHVVVAPTVAVVAAVNNELGAGRGAPTGGIRLLWPSWRSVDPPARHTQWHAEDVAGPDGPRPRVAEALAQAVIGAATLRVEADPLVPHLARKQSAEQRTVRREELETLRHAVAADQAAAEDLISEYQSELTRADERAYELAVELEREHETRVRAVDAYLRLATQVPTSGDAPVVRSLAEAVRLAKSTLPHLVFLPEAERAAKNWQFDRADLVFADFRRLDAVAADWAANALRVDFGTACREIGLDWARDVGDDAKRKSDEYVRTYQGKPIVLGPHFRQWGQPPVRVYCYLDEANRRVIVGHVGRHLSDRTT